MLVKLILGTLMTLCYLAMFALALLPVAVAVFEDRKDR